MSSSEDEISGQAKIAVDMLVAAAEKVRANAENGFAGAFVIVPPAGEPKELLLLNNTGNLAMFWSLVMTTAQMVVSELQEEERQVGAMRR